MKRFFFVISIFLSSIPLASLIIYFYHTLETISEDSLRAEITKEVQLTAAGIADFVDERNANIVDWAQSPAFLVAFDFSRPEGLAATLNKINGRYLMYESLTVLELKGSVFASSDNATSRLDERDFEALTSVKDAKVWYSDSRFELSIPIIGSLGHPLGYLIAKIKTGVVRSFLDRMSLRLAKARLDSLEVQIGREPAEIPGKAVFKTEIKPRTISLTSPLFIVASVNKNELTKLSNQFILYVSLLALGLAVFAFLGQLYVFSLVLAPIQAMLSSLGQIAEGKHAPVKLGSRYKEIRELEAQANKIVERLETYSQSLAEQAEIKAMDAMARQVAHDIRAPVSALRMVLPSLGNLPKESQDLINQCAKRIADIADDLLVKRKGRQTASINSYMQSDRQSAGELIKSAIREKELLLKERPQITIGFSTDPTLTDDDQRIRVSSSDFQRVISNLLNNSIEALDGDGKVAVNLKKVGPRLVITIKDNGVGISEDVLAKIGARGVTFGKLGGSGLGVAHAKECVENWGGTLSIQSNVNEGTTVSIFLPIAPL